MYDAAMPNVVPMGQALASSQSQSGRGVESGRGYPAPAAAGTGFLMLPPVGSSSSLAYGSSGGGHSSGSSFGPAVHGYGRSGAAPVAFGSSPPFGESAMRVVYSHCNYCVCQVPTLAVLGEFFPP